ncbi:hypothetical protein [Serratia marcescens]|uniref:hypothetical protein n=1 Tax=Serratia marcescens TaxID=615 RepID=UPI003CFBEF9A
MGRSSERIVSLLKVVRRYRKEWEAQMGMCHSIAQSSAGGAQARHDGQNYRRDAVSSCDHWDITVVDVCCYGRAGIKAVLQKHLGVIRVVTTEALDGPLSLFAARSLTASPLSCLVLRLPQQAPAALSMLLQLGDLSAARYSRIVVMSSVAPDVVFRMLANIGINCAVRIVDVRSSPSVLCEAVLSPLSGTGEILPGESGTLLSPIERRVLRRTLHEMSIYTQARQAQVSAKTIYTQRAQALLKLGVPDVLTLLRQFLPTSRMGVGECDVKRRKRW